jgi:hypothetical protein
MILDDFFELTCGSSPISSLLSGFKLFSLYILLLISLLHMFEESWNPVGISFQANNSCGYPIRRGGSFITLMATAGTILITIP